MYIGESILRGKETLRDEGKGLVEEGTARMFGGQQA